MHTYRNFVKECILRETNQNPLWHQYRMNSTKIKFFSDRIYVHYPDIRIYPFPIQMGSLLYGVWNAKNNCFSIHSRDRIDTMYDTMIPSSEQFQTREIFIHFIAFLYIHKSYKCSSHSMNFHCNRWTEIIEAPRGFRPGAYLI